ncbi:hypothetical protein KFL_015300010, partial [Klebsormidium nitens]
MGVGDTPTGVTDTLPGAGATPTGEAGTGSEESVETDGEETADRRYPARARWAPGEWYRANLAAETGKHLKGLGEHPEAIGGEESVFRRNSMDEEMRSLLENGTWELVEKTGR